MPTILKIVKTATSNFLDLVKARISIRVQIVYPTPIEVPITTPRVIEVINTEPILKRKSDFRFVQRTKVDIDGKETILYHTECFDGKEWKQDIRSLSTDKNKAMDLHLKLLEFGTLEEKTTTTVLWEGLTKDEATAWVELQK